MMTPGDTIKDFGAVRNLIWVTLGNAFAGAVLMGYGYWLVAGRPGLQDRNVPADEQRSIAETGE